MEMKSVVFLGCFYLFFYGLLAGGYGGLEGIRNSNYSAMELPDHSSFNVVSSSDSDCNFSKPITVTHLQQQKVDQFKREEEGFKLLPSKPSVKLNLTHKPPDSVADSTAKDHKRIQTFHNRIIEKKNRNSFSRLKKNNDEQAYKPIVPPVGSLDPPETLFSGQLMTTLESGMSLGSGEYFIDVQIGTPPKHYSLILDTGSDLIWIQCVPCYDCFEQSSSYYDPKDSNSYTNISCNDPRCHLVSPPEPSQPCNSLNQSCPYYYWYGDSSNTTGDLALETFTVNLTAPNGQSHFRKVENVIFGCGHWNRGLFHGAAGLLGLGKGPLSFSSQLQALYGHSFSYCLVDRNSNSSVSSKLIFGEDDELLSHPELNYTAFVTGKENQVDTFYYLQIKWITVGGEVLNIPTDSWGLSSKGEGGTIIDSGTTLTYFADPAYQIIKEAFLKNVNYPLVKNLPILDPCYNISNVNKPKLPSFGIVFNDGAVWNFPAENYFIKFDEDDVICLAILGIPQSSLSIIGNYQQQNFHILYDVKRSRLGFAPTKCADV